MLLKSIEMQGFKSFPDKTVLELGKGITGVVGPNGSGKSNISDAVRWVLGEQSTKALRGSRMEDVIFGGTSSRRALGYAEVTLRLDNKDRSLPKDDDVVAVTRRYYRSGESEYKINGEEVRLRDIHEMFMDTGLGRDGYSMVSQGKIADLVSAKSSQRRDMLEEAAGISHYRYRRADANRRLALAEENLVRLRDILAELESRIGPLKTKSEKALKYLALAEEKKGLEIGLWINTIEKAEKGLKDQETKLTIAQSQYDSAEKELSETETGTEQALEKSREITIEIEALTGTISESEEQAAVTEGRINVEKRNIEHNTETAARLRLDVGDGEQAVAQAEKEAEDARLAIEEKEKQIEEKKKELAAELEKLNDILGKNGENSEQAAQAGKQLAEINMLIGTLNADKSSALATIKELNDRIAAIEELLEARGGITEEIKKQIKTAREGRQKLLDEKQENENALDGHRLIIETRQGKADKLQKELDDLNLDLYQKNARIKMLDDLERNLDGYSGSVQKVIKEAKRGALKGIHGTLSQLISTAPEYSTAIEIALGAAIQNIVTDDENSAKRAIGFLKDSRAGRATFLPLTSFKGREFTEKGLDDCDGYIDIASNLVSCDKKYNEIIISLLGRTAVVETIDDAIAMAKKYSYRFKIVTLDGQVMNAGGSMTGGSKGSGTGFLSRLSEIEALREKTAAIEKALKEKQASFDTVQGEINEVKAQLDAGEAEIIKLDEQIIIAEGEIKLLEDRLSTAEGHINDLLEEKKRSEARIAEFEKSGGETDEKITKLNEEAAALNARLEELSEEKTALEELREKSAAIQNEINIAIVSLGKETEALRETMEAALARKEALTTKGSTLAAEIEKLLEDNESISKTIEELEKEAAALREKAAQSAERIKELVEERNSTEAVTAELRAKEKEKNAEKEKLSGELARLEERKQALETSLETTKNKLYDEYSLTYREAREISDIPEDIGKAQRILQEIKSKIRSLGDVDPGAVEEYKEVSERYEYMSGQISDVEKSKAELEKIIEDLTNKMAERFREQFRRINTAFGETFRELFDGGRAELSPDDPQDVLECNISIKVQPPGKNVQNIDLLSGGEKGLAAIALLFAILKVNPAPFCIFDEVEAALDDINVTRYANYVRSMTGNTQFILITHRRGTMDEADILYGVTMQEKGVSKMLELKSSEMAKKFGLDN